MAFIYPVADVSGLIDRFNLVKRQYPDDLILQKEQKHFAVAALVQYHVALHVAPGFIFVTNVSRPAQRLLEPALVFHHQLVQFRNGNELVWRGVFGRHGVL
jgi:hypothetical protein